MIKAKTAILDVFHFIFPWRSDPITPHCLERYKPEILKNIKPLFFIACVFYLNGVFYNGSFFAPDVWGYFATQFPSQMWATISLVGSAAIIIGLLKPPIGWMVSVGALIMYLNFAALGFSAIFTSQNLNGFFIGLYNFIFFAPYFFRIFLMGVRSYAPK